ncbi:MAG: hypothetical protein IJ793_01265 [Opitutales bacterium]|nr:hypothetical protein [Opitutales bacterium]
MEEYLFIDAHAFQLQTARLEFRNRHWHVTETHRYTESVPEKQWTKTFKKSWASITKNAPKEIIFILPDAFVGTLSVPINGDTNFSVEQRLHRALAKKFRFRFQKYYYRFAPLEEQRYHMEFIAKERLQALRAVTEGTSNVHYISSIAACWSYFNTLTTDRWPHIALFLEPPLRRLFGYTEQGVRYADFYASEREKTSKGFSDWSIFSTEALGIENHGKRLTIIGNLEPEAENTIREELHAEVILKVAELSGDVSSLSAVSQTVCVGALLLLETPKHPLKVFDFSTVKIRFLSKRTKCIFRLLTAVNILIACMLSVTLYQKNQSMREKEIQYKLLSEQRSRCEQLNTDAKRLEEENHSRCLFPKTFLHLLERFEQTDVDGCIDELSTEVSENGAFVIVKGRTETSRETFNKVLKRIFSEEIKTHNIPIDWRTSDDRRNAFVVKIPVILPKEEKK